MQNTIMRGGASYHQSFGARFGVVLNSTDYMTDPLGKWFTGTLGKMTWLGILRQRLDWIDLKIEKNERVQPKFLVFKPRVLAGD